MKKPLLLFVLVNLASIVFAVGAVVAICEGVEEGWGWLLVLSLLTHESTININEEGKL